MYRQIHIIITILTFLLYIACLRLSYILKMKKGTPEYMQSKISFPKEFLELSENVSTTTLLSRTASRDVRMYTSDMSNIIHEPGKTPLNIEKVIIINNQGTPP